MRILILEDDPFIALDLQAIVEAEGHVASVCASVAEARRWLDDDIDFALLDVDVRDGKSFEVALAFQERAVGFAFVTGSKRSEIPAALSCAGFVAKPFLEEAILACLPGPPPGLAGRPRSPIPPSGPRSDPKTPLDARRRSGEPSGSGEGAHAGFGCAAAPSLRRRGARRRVRRGRSTRASTPACSPSTRASRRPSGHGRDGADLPLASRPLRPARDRLCRPRRRRFSRSRRSARRARRRGGCGACRSSMAARSASTSKTSPRVTASSPDELIAPARGADLPRLHDRLRAGLYLSRRARSGHRDAAPRGAAHAGRRRARSRSAASRRSSPRSRRRAAGTFSDARRCAPSWPSGTRSSSWRPATGSGSCPIAASEWDALDRAGRGRRAGRGGRSDDGARRSKACGPGTSLAGCRPLRLRSATASPVPAPWTGSRSPPPTRSSATRRAPPRSSSCCSAGRFDGGGRLGALAVAGAPCALDARRRAGSRRCAPRAARRTGRRRSGRCRRASSPISRSSGGFDLPPQLGSLSLHQRAGARRLSRPRLPGRRPLPLRLAEAPRGPSLALDRLPLDAATRPSGSCSVRRTTISRKAGLATFLVRLLRRLAGGRPHGLPPVRAADRARPRLQHRLRRHRGRLGAGARLRRADRHDGGSADDRRLPEDRHRRSRADLRARGAAPARRGRPLRGDRRSRRRSTSPGSGPGDRRLPMPRRGPLGAGLPPTEALLGLNLAGAAVDAFRQPWKSEPVASGGELAPRGGRSWRDAGEEVVDLRPRRRRERRAGLALRVAGEDAAAHQHVFAHRKPDARLLLVADEGQMRVEEVVRLVALAGLLRGARRRRACPGRRSRSWRRRRRAPSRNRGTGRRCRTGSRCGRIELPSAWKPRSAEIFSSPGQSSCFSITQDGLSCTMRRITAGVITTEKRERVVLDDEGDVGADRLAGLRDSR